MHPLVYASLYKNLDAALYRLTSVSGQAAWEYNNPRHRCPLLSSPMFYPWWCPSGAPTAWWSPSGCWFLPTPAWCRFHSLQSLPDSWAAYPWPQTGPPRNCHSCLDLPRGWQPLISGHSIQQDSSHWSWTSPSLLAGSDDRVMKLLVPRHPHGALEPAIRRLVRLWVKVHLVTCTSLSFLICMISLYCKVQRISFFLNFICG
jgi:hypothetical protein